MVLKQEEMQEKTMRIQERIREVSLMQEINKQYQVNTLQENTDNTDGKTDRKKSVRIFQRNSDENLSEIYFGKFVGTASENPDRIHSSVFRHTIPTENRQKTDKYMTVAKN